MKAAWGDSNDIIVRISRQALIKDMLQRLEMEEEQRTSSGLAEAAGDSAESAGGAAESAGGAAEALGAEAAGDADEAADGRGVQPMLVWPRVILNLAHDDIDAGDEAGSFWLIDRPQVLAAGNQVTAIAAKAREPPPPPTITGSALKCMGAALERRVRDPPPQPPPPSLPPLHFARTSSDVMQ